MREELDMTGAKRVGYNEGKMLPYAKSLCDNCLYPLGKCQWLLFGKPYSGAEYIEHKVLWADNSRYSVYTVTKCPHYEGIKNE